MQRQSRLLVDLACPPGITTLRRPLFGLEFFRLVLAHHPLELGLGPVGQGRAVVDVDGGRSVLRIKFGILVHVRLAVLRFDKVVALARRDARAIDADAHEEG